MKNKKMNGILKKGLVLVVFAYVVFTLVNQQKSLNQYSADCEQLSTQIEEETEKKEELAKKKEAVNSLDFIEQMAREKLEMYYPNEKVYIDKGM